VDQVDGNGETPLLVAVEKNNPEAIKLLLEFGANPSTKNRLGDSPIDKAVDSKNTAVLDLLIKGQVDILSR
jgi:ankyrin repeat protein